MKILLFVVTSFIIISNISVWSQTNKNSLQGREISLVCNQMPLRSFLRHLEKEFHIHFIFHDALVDNIRITCTLKNESQKSILNKIFPDHHIAYQFLTANTIILSAKNESKRNRYIKGQIVDVNTNKPIELVNAFIPHTQNGAATNDNGEFSFKVAANDDTLMISHISYRPLRVQIPKHIEYLTIPLEPAVHQFNPLSVIPKPLIEQIKKEQQQQLQEEPNIGVIPELSQPISYASYLQYRTDNVYIVEHRNEKDELYDRSFNVDLSHNKHRPKIQPDRMAKLLFHDNRVHFNEANLSMPVHATLFPGMNSSIIYPGMISSFQIINGILPPAYEEPATSIFNIYSIDDNIGNVTGEVTSSWTESGIFIKGPLINKGSFAVSGKKSHVSPMLGALNKTIPVDLGYHDIQSQIQFKILPNFSISSQYIRINDQMKIHPAIQFENPRLLSVDDRYSSNSNASIPGLQTTIEKSVDICTYKNQIVTANLAYQFSEELSAELKLSWNKLTNKNLSNWSGYYQTETDSIPDKKHFQAYDSHSTHQMNNHAKEVKWLFHLRNINKHEWEFGIQYKQNPYTMTSSEKESIHIVGGDKTPYLNWHFSNSQYFHQQAAYVYDNCQIHTRLSLLFGLRYDHYSISQTSFLHPRITIFYKPNINHILKTGYGAYSNLPHYNAMKQYLNQDNPNLFGYFNKSSINIRKTQHLVIQYESQWSSIFETSIQLYQKKYESAVPIESLPDGYLKYHIQGRCNALERGLEFDATCRGQQWYIGLRYRLFKAAESYQLIPATYPGYNDRRHLFSWMIHQNFPKGWTLDLDGQWGSGHPFSPYIISDPENEIEKFRDYFPVWNSDDNGFNQGRFPPFFNLNVRLEKSFQFSYGKLSLFAQVYNVINYKNVYNYIYTYDQDGNPIRIEESFFSFIPYGGASFSF